MAAERYQTWGVDQPARPAKLSSLAGFFLISASIVSMGVFVAGYARHLLGFDYSVVVEGDTIPGTVAIGFWSQCVTVTVEQQEHSVCGIITGGDIRFTLSKAMMGFAVGMMFVSFIVLCMNACHLATKRRAKIAGVSLLIAGLLGFAATGWFVGSIANNLASLQQSSESLAALKVLGHHFIDGTYLCFVGAAISFLSGIAVLIHGKEIPELVIAPVRYPDAGAAALPPQPYGFGEQLAPYYQPPQGAEQQTKPSGGIV